MKSNTLKKDLKELEKLYKLARSRWTFQSSYKKSRHKILNTFGITNISSKDIPVTSLKDIDLMYESFKVILRERYQKLIPEKIEVQEDIPALELEYIEKDTIENSIFNPNLQEAKLLTQSDGCNQITNAKILFDNIYYNKVSGQLLLAQTGAGKTYIIGSVIKNLLSNNFLNNYKGIHPWPILYVTKASVVEQTKKVLRDEFGLDTTNIVHVINIELLRSELGSLFVNEEVEVINGQDHIIYKWKKIHPILFIWDECQILAREQSIQSKIAQDTNRIESRYNVPIYQIFSSATPFSRVWEARVFAVSTKTKFKLGMGEVTLNDNNWKHFSQIVASPSDPMDYCEAAVSRLVEKLEPFIVRVKNIRPKHKAINSTQKIYFKTKEEREEYDKAWEQYQEAKAKIEGDESLSASQSRFALLAQFTIFAKAAEYIRRNHLAEFCYKTWKNDRAPVIACRFKRTITGTYKILVEDYGWNRDDVSIIWGGATESLSVKKKLAQKVKMNSAFKEALEEADIDIEEILGLDLSNLNEKTEEDLAFEKLHDLVSQKPEEREREKMRFQKQRSKACFFTFKSGGVGLSLHHQYEYARPREVILTPVYSEKELIQGLGRCPRITSLSDTHQRMVYYAGTIEEHVAARVSIKLRCMKKVVKFNESWEDILIGKKILRKAEEELPESNEGNTLMEYEDENDNK